MARLVLFLLLLGASLAHAADSPKDVQALIARGDYAGAEAMLREAVAEHPQSAKAHYVLAEVLAHRGNIADAKAEATKAATLDPSTRFTDPAKFQAFQRELDAALGSTTQAPRGDTAARFGDDARSATGSGGSSHFTTILVIGGVVILALILLMRKKRDATPVPGPYAGTPPTDGVPPYSGYTSNSPHPPMPPQPQAPHSGVGTAVAAGLGGVAAGMLLDEALRSHGESTEPRDVTPVSRDDRDPSGQAYDDLRDRPIDMGNDDSSWGDGSSGDDDSSDDNNW
ncbi:tetratricopeptide repeat protein [Luteibacter sp. 3190]|uniref:tetratricopeptide repeat protein n=1 Tax=Luteibacter sp. 3190 TaxID=2817736 RepID=UPI00285610C0|nr:tetratricopeptide repeat protein [Luteibacter sp. 3190]MDR6937350.1 hypothetical protein [Luteibacter sp. 3190]